jgi:hypothetical protein
LVNSCNFLDVELYWEEKINNVSKAITMLLWVDDAAILECMILTTNNKQIARKGNGAIKYFGHKGVGANAVANIAAARMQVNRSLKA